MPKTHFCVNNEISSEVFALSLPSRNDYAEKMLTNRMFSFKPLYFAQVHSKRNNIPNIVCIRIRCKFVCLTLEKLESLKKCFFV